MAENMLERRAAMLAGRISARKKRLREALAPPGQRPPFTKQLTKQEALEFWRLHRHDETGAEVLARMSDLEIAELDTALAQMGVPYGGQPSGSGL